MCQRQSGGGGGGGGGAGGGGGGGAEALAVCHTLTALLWVRWRYAVSFWMPGCQGVRVRKKGEVSRRSEDL